VELDPEFYQPYVWLIIGYYWANRMDRVDSLWNVIQPAWDKFTRYEQNMLSFAYAYSQKRFPEAFRFVYENAKRYPDDYYSNTEAGMTALVLLNRPQTCLNIYEHLISQKFDYGTEPWKSSWLIYYHQALIRLKKFDEVVASCKSYSFSDFSDFNVIYRPLVTAYGLQGKGALIQELIKQSERDAIFSPFIENNLLGMGVYYLALGGHKEQALALKNVLMDRIQGQPLTTQLQFPKEILLHILYRGSAAGLHYFTQDWDQALDELLSNKFKDFEEYLYYLGRLGCVYARLGKTSKAEEIIGKLMSKESDYLGSIGHENAFLYYSIGQIRAVLGEREKAIENLRRSSREGLGHIFEFFHYDMDLESLQGYPPFEAMLLQDE